MKRGNGVSTYLALDLKRQEQVILKTAARNSLSQQAQLRLEHEAQVLGRLNSPWLAPLVHLGSEEEFLFLAMALVPGITLAARLEQSPLTVREVLTVGGCLFSALQEVHEHGILHRDLKPANIIVDEGRPLCRAVLVDFGLARSAALDASMRDQPVGTARYLSPEQAGLLEREPGEQADLYSAGAVLYECLAGRPPFLGDSIGEVLRQHMTVPTPSLRSLGVGVPRVLDELLQRLLRKDPRDRYQSAEAVRFDLQRIGEALERGESEPVMIVGACDRRRSLTQPAFVGRGKELAVLEEQLAAAGRGQGGLVLLEAESGGGKTHLLDEFAERSLARRTWVLRGQGLDRGAQRPLQVLAGVVAGLLGQAKRDLALAQQLRCALGEQREAVCAALPELADILGVPASSSLGPEKFGELRTLQALAALLDALGSPERPALVLLDDCQWADELTLALLRAWQSQTGARGPMSSEADPECPAGSHVLIVVAFRAEEAGEEHLIRRLSPNAHLCLEPFGQDDVRRLAESMAGPLPVEAVAAVERLSEGSPFLAAAVLQGLVESGALQPEEPTGWQVDPLALADVQSSRHAAAFLVRRIESLPPGVLHLLSAGAILGKEFDLSAAATLAQQQPEQARAALEEAHRRHIVWPGRTGGVCAFLHDKLRQTCLDRIPADERRELHRRAALFIEANGAGIRPEHLPGPRGAPAESSAFELAYHFDAAGDSARALPYALVAAERARTRHALAVAEQQYQIAQRGLCGADDRTRYRVAEGMGEVLMLRGRYSDSAEAFVRALSLASDKLTQARIRGKLGELAFKRGEVGNAGQRIESALALLGERIPRWPWSFLLCMLWQVLVQSLHTLLPRWLVGRRPLDGAETALLVTRLLSRLAHLYWFHRGTVPSLWAHLRGMNLAERHPPTLELAQAYSEHAPGMSLIGYFSRGIAYAEKSLAIRKDLGDLWGQGQSLHFYGVVLYASSRFPACIAKCREAVRLLERTGDFWEMHIARYQTAASQYRLGNLRQAVEEARRIYQSGIDLGDVQASGIILDVWARASLGRVPPELIQAERNRPSEDVQRRAQVLLAEGVCLLYQAKPVEAAAVLQQALKGTQKAGVMNAWVAPVWPWLASAYRQQAEAAPWLSPGRRQDLLTRAWRAARRALSIARRFRNELPHALRECGLLAAMRGQPRRARRCLAESLRTAERQEARFEQAQTRLARGRVGVELGWPGASHELAEAQQSLRRFEADVLGSDPIHSQEPVRPVTLSLADRFDTLLDAGRCIASALSRESVFAAARDAALKLLRGEDCLLLLERDLGDLKDKPWAVCLDSAGPGTRTPPDGSAIHSTLLARQAMTAGHSIRYVEGVTESSSESVLLAGVRSALCAPIFVRGEAIGCIHISHCNAAGLFGEDELRLADFIAVLTGAALENADGFAELHRLNVTLEQRVQELRVAQMHIQEQAALLDKAHDAISVQDLEGRILFWNPSAERLYGWSAEEALGRASSELLQRSASAKAPREVLQESGAASEVSVSPSAAAMMAAGEWAGELRHVSRAGKEVVVESRWTLVRDGEGKPKSWLVVSTDITQKKKLEACFLRAQRMESLGKLAGGVAHDINNVLLPILLSIELLREPLPQSERLAILQNLETVTLRGASMVKQILSFARGVEGQRILLHLKHPINELEKILTSTFPKSIELRTYAPRDLWLISGDTTQLHQLLMNLSVNARDAMPDGGVLTIAASNTRLIEADVSLHVGVRPGPYVLLEVTDTGTGIPREILDKIFDPFFTTKEYGKGTGLGLSTVLGVVKGHGGFIQVHSEMGSGTRFLIHLPAAETSEKPESLPATANRRQKVEGQGELVLIVDDEAAIRGVARRTLESAGFRTLLAKSGQEALQLYPRHRDEIRLVLLDMMMPGLDGAATLRALRQMNPEVRVVLMSGLKSSIEPAAAGAQAILSKPFRADELNETIRRVLGS